MKYYTTLNDSVKDIIESESNLLNINGYIEVYVRRDIAIRMRSPCDNWIMVLDMPNKERTVELLSNREIKAFMKRIVPIKNNETSYERIEG